MTSIKTSTAHSDLINSWWISWTCV